jgi:hypothetical protein
LRGKDFFRQRTSLRAKRATKQAAIEHPIRPDDPGRAECKRENPAAGRIFTNERSEMGF